MPKMVKPTKSYAGRVDLKSNIQAKEKGDLSFDVPDIEGSIRAHRAYEEGEEIRIAAWRREAPDGTLSEEFLGGKASDPLKTYKDRKYHDDKNNWDIFS